MAPSQDFKVQRLTAAWLPGDPKIQSVPIPSPLDDPSKAFCFVANTARFGVRQFKYGQDAELQHWAGGITSATATHVTVERPTGFARYGVMTLVVVEYIGPAGGPNEVQVRGLTTPLMVAQLTASTPLPASVADWSRCVAFPRGGRAITGLTSTSNASSVNLQAQPASGDLLNLKRGANAAAIAYAFDIVEFTGSNWTVHQEWDIQNTGGTNAHTLPTPVADWSKTAAFASRSSVSGVTENLGVSIWPGASVSQYRSRFDPVHAPDAANDRFAVTFVENPEWHVEWQDSLTGSGSTISGIGAYRLPVSAVVDDEIDNAMSLFMATVAAGTDSYQYARFLWDHILRPDGSGGYEVAGGRDWIDCDTDWSLQVVRWPKSSGQSIVGADDLVRQRYGAEDDSIGPRFVAHNALGAGIRTEDDVCLEGWREGGLQ